MLAGTFQGGSPSVCRTSVTYLLAHRLNKSNRLNFSFFPGFLDSKITSPNVFSISRYEDYFCCNHTDVPPHRRKVIIFKTGFTAFHFLFHLQDSDYLKTFALNGQLNLQHSEYIHLISMNFKCLFPPFCMIICHRTFTTTLACYLRIIDITFRSHGQVKISSEFTRSAKFVLI
ncbi:hypothetical protein EGR_06019 [Echinococcus granulosus]|uniref:Uncharacterized protein n=1 Tax=Echinococcus granulosus TaxID=6210 RepID=W6UE60_ECHGR|nr:hypothetical protein EGR_06019 [Echinococcus granulosus]EUB59156.1 hypothetical protein EGR_06019 [Echinococcus granulosus]